MAQYDKNVEKKVTKKFQLIGQPEYIFILVYRIDIFVSCLINSSNLHIYIYAIIAEYLFKIQIC